MNSITEEIQQLQSRILELEKQQKEKEKEENENNTSIDHNFNVINDLLNKKKKKTAINNNRYSKAFQLARYYDQELVTHLEAIYNILHIIDDRLTKLEEK